MNEQIIEEISKDLNVNQERIKTTLKLLEEGNTVPFIARYRKEMTGALDEEQIRKINEVYEYQVNLLKRKEDVIRLIEEKGLLTEELKKEILSCSKLVEVEDLYRPYKEKKKTKATEAIKNGLEPLAKMMMSFKIEGSLEELSKKFLNENVKTPDEAIEGAKYIIAEWVSDNAYYRKWIRNYIYRNGVMKTAIKKNVLKQIEEQKAKQEMEQKSEQGSEQKEKQNSEKSYIYKYEMYYDYNEQVKFIKPHRILAINRAEKEKVINVSIVVDSDKIIEYLESKLIKSNVSYVNHIKEAILDSYKRLIFPSIEREIRADLTEKAEDQAIVNFSKNLEALLLTPPLKETTVLAFDPGFTNGCKLAVIDKTGKYLTSTVINPFAHSKFELEKAKKELIDLIKKYSVDIIAIGNGTASRESEKLIAELIKENNLDTKYVIVSEAGASIYSTEPIAKEEFPDLTPNERSAVSIGRRLQDALSELVKIPPEGIGVGLYQHDVQAKKLKQSLDAVVEDSVNKVGVNVNTASSALLKYVSGFNKSSINKIINYREKQGKIMSREEIKKILGDKTYEQAIGFLRILEGTNPLDQTDIHPESYKATLELLKMLDSNISELGTKELSDKLEKLDTENVKDKLNIDMYTLEDIINSLKKPNRDPRDSYPQPILKSDVLNIEDVKVGMKLEGTVRNVVDFGAFIDIGLHNDGLVHISKMSKEYIKHPTDILSVGDIIDVYVLEVDKEKNKVSLSLIEE